MNQNIVSIIVPVYNMQSLLARCIESILNQTYPFIQLVLVDDGSTDESLAICKKYDDENDRVVVIHKGNSGVADATNIGLDHASGDYIMFVDSDDFIDITMVEMLLSAQERSGADIVQTGMTRINDRNEITDISEHAEIRITGTENIIKEFFSGDSILLCLASKLFKRSIFDGFRFESGRNIIDILATPFLLQKCSCYHIIQGAPYYAYFRSDSVSRGLMTDKTYDDTIYYLKKWKSFLDTYYSGNQEFEVRLQFRTCYEMSTRYELIQKSPAVSGKVNKLAEMRKMFRSGYKYLRRSTYYYSYPSRRRLMFFIFLINPYLMTIASRINSKIKGHG